MIYDGLGAMHLYKGLYRGLDVLIDWLAENDINELPLGITEIDGKRVYANTMNAKVKSLDEAHFETHHKYMDVQVDLEGYECFKTTPGAVVPFGDFDEATDKGYCDAAEGNTDMLDGTLENGHFAIFVIDEPHMPNLAPEGVEPGSPLKKICFKVVGDQYWDEV